MFQAVDEEQVFLTGKDFFDCCANFRSSNGCVLNEEGSLTLKAELKKLKVVNWYNVLKRRSGMTTAHSMQRKFASESFVTRNGEISHSHKWSYYQNGTHKPNARTVESVEGLMPGSARELDLVLWTALDVTQPIGKYANTKFLKMGSHIPKAIFNEPFKDYERLSRRKSNVYIAKLLFKKCNLDSLAVLTILAREATEEKRNEDAYFWGCQTYSMLIILGQELHERGIACSTINLYRELIFRKITWDGFYFKDTEEDIVNASAHLALSVFTISKNKAATLAWEDRVAYMKRLLRGDFGRDVFFALKPRWAPINEVSIERQLKYEKEQRLRAWGWDSIYGMVPTTPFPPNEVINR